MLAITYRTQTQSPYDNRSRSPAKKRQYAGSHAKLLLRDFVPHIVQLHDRGTYGKLTELRSPSKQEGCCCITGEEGLLCLGFRMESYRAEKKRFKTMGPGKKATRTKDARQCELLKCGSLSKSRWHRHRKRLQQRLPLRQEKTSCISA